MATGIPTVAPGSSNAAAPAGRRIDPHPALEVDGAVGRLRADLWHHTSETLNRQVAKTVQYADDFVRHCAQQGRRIRFTDLLVRPVWRFLRAYLFKLGFLDGWQGYTIAWMTAFYTFLRYAKAHEAQTKQERGPSSKNAG